MYVPFSELPEEARIWIYQCNRSFTDEEIEEIKNKIENFLENWQAHGAGLKSSYELKYRRFIIIGVDTSVQNTTGCSIDASVGFIQNLEKEYNVDLLDKMNVSFKQGEFIAYKPLKDFRTMAKEKSVSPKTIVFNNLVNNKYEYENFWEVPTSESWHSRFVK